MAAKDEGHGFRKKTNRDAMTEAVVLFMNKLSKTNNNQCYSAAAAALISFLSPLGS